MVLTHRCPAWASVPCFSWGGGPTKETAKYKCLGWWCLLIGALLKKKKSLTFHRCSSPVPSHTIMVYLRPWNLKWQTQLCRGLSWCGMAVWPISDIYMVSQSYYARVYIAHEQKMLCGIVRVLYMYAYIHICICIYELEWIRINIHIYKCTYIYTDTRPCFYTYTNIYECINKHIHKRKCMQTCINVRVHLHIHVDIHCTYTYMYMRKESSVLSRSICLNINEMIWNIWIMDHLSEWYFCDFDSDLIVWIRIYIQTRSLSKKIRIVGVLFFIISSPKTWIGLTFDNGFSPIHLIWWFWF